VVLSASGPAMLGAVSGEVGAAGAAGAAAAGGVVSVGAGGGAAVCAQAAVIPYCQPTTRAMPATLNRSVFEMPRSMLCVPTDRQVPWHDATDGDGPRHLLEVYNTGAYGQ
jgi:hypothetical protein